MLKTGLFVGSFDPFTLGHYDIVSRAAKLFDRLYIGVAADTSGKTCRLTTQQRLEIVRLSVCDVPNVTVEPFEGFLVRYARQIGADGIVRGLRTASDFEYERALAEVYRSQDPQLETLYLTARPCYAHVSGSTVRELIALGGSVRGYVCASAEQLIVNKYAKRNEQA